MERPVRSLGNGFPLGSLATLARWEDAVHREGFSLLIFLGSQVLACLGSPVRSGVLDSHGTQDTFKALTSPAGKNLDGPVPACCLSTPNTMDRETKSLGGGQ